MLIDTISVMKLVPVTEPPVTVRGNALSCNVIRYMSRLEMRAHIDEQQRHATFPFTTRTATLGLLFPENQLG